MTAHGMTRLERMERHFAYGDPDECWLWRGRVSRGYGRFDATGAYRALYEELRGPVPPGLTLDHLCRNPLCVNPAHLEPVTLRENLARRDNEYLVARWEAFREAQTHCAPGLHEMIEANVYHRPDGARICRECRRASQVAAKAKAKLKRLAEGQAG